MGTPTHTSSTQRQGCRDFHTPSIIVEASTQSAVSSASSTVWLTHPENSPSRMATAYTTKLVRDAELRWRGLAVWTGLCKTSECSRADDTSSADEKGQLSRSEEHTSELSH